MNWRSASAALGAVAVAVAAVAVHAPGLLPVAQVDRLLEGASQLVLVASLGLLASGYAVLAALAARLGRSGPGPLVDAPPELPREGSTAVVAAAFDAAFEGGASEDVLREELREAAADALMRAAGVDRPSALEAVAAGEWTDDRRAAAFLGEDVEPPPLSTRLRDWLAGEPRTRRYARHALEAVERTWTGTTPEVSGGD